jgi:hypothetical protein
LSHCLSRPWDTPETILSDAGVELGENYPLPIVTVEESEHALALAAAVIHKSIVVENGPGSLKVGGAQAPWSLPVQGLLTVLCCCVWSGSCVAHF